jgi:hypothetical protein
VADSDNDIENRVGILEREVARLREQAALTGSDAAAARVLAAGADHDVSEVRSELRAHTRALNALRETQLEQGQVLAEHGRMLTGQSEAITSIRQELTEQGEAIAGQGQAILSLDQKMSAGFGTLHTGMAKIIALLENAGSEQD